MFDVYVLRTSITPVANALHKAQALLKQIPEVKRKTGHERLTKKKHTHTQPNEYKKCMKKEKLEPLQCFVGIILIDKVKYHATLFLWCGSRFLPIFLSLSLDLSLVCARPKSRQQRQQQHTFSWSNNIVAYSNCFHRLSFAHMKCTECYR